jgi:hypothetical protein
MVDAGLAALVERGHDRKEAAVEDERWSQN